MNAKTSSIYLQCLDHASSEAKVHVVQIMGSTSKKDPMKTPLERSVPLYMLHNTAKGKSISSHFQTMSECTSNPIHKYV